jgi:hypothetical protein
MSKALKSALPALEERGFNILFQSHARAILTVDFPAVIEELDTTLSHMTIPIEEIIGSGGGEAKGTQRLRKGLAAQGWTKTTFEIKKTINGQPRESISHEVDHVRNFDDRGTVALEIEWNNKDPFFDRDLENFKRLHAEGAISVGIIVTRGILLQDNIKSLVLKFAHERKITGFADLEPYGVVPTRRQREEIEKRTQRKKDPLSFQEAWTDHFVSDKYGAATTHWRKLMDRVQRGVGNPCPLLLIGIPDNVVVFDNADRSTAARH